jgi:hypothetical protein
MSPKTKTQQWLQIKNDYRLEHHDVPASPRTMLDWAIETGRFKIDARKARQRAADELADAMRSEMTRDANGNEVRVNLAFETENGWLWDQRDTISRPHMELNVSHARRMAYGDIKATVLSVNDYNERHPDEAPIQFSLNFAGDLADDGIPIPPASSELEQLIGQSPHAGPESVSEREQPRPSVPRADLAQPQPDSSSASKEKAKPGQPPRL